VGGDEHKTKEWWLAPESEREEEKTQT
jgi:hypothetical protein